MEIRPATPDDAAAIAAVGRETWHDTYDGIMGREAVEERVAEWYDPGTVRGYFADEAFRAYVAETADGVVGYAYSRRGQDVNADDPGTGVWHLPAVYVHPDAQGDGIGAALVGRVEADARDADAGVVRLVVLAANEAARGFYEARGYERIDEREEPTVPDTRELVYEKRL
jgi:ribosomal protein S18 acetylase RimI-like enzyme